MIAGTAISTIIEGTIVPTMIAGPKNLLAAVPTSLVGPVVPTITVETTVPTSTDGTTVQNIFAETKNFFSCSNKFCCNTCFKYACWDIYIR